MWASHTASMALKTFILYLHALCFCMYWTFGWFRNIFLCLYRNLSFFKQILCIKTKTCILALIISMLIFADFLLIKIIFESDIFILWGSVIFVWQELIYSNASSYFISSHSPGCCFFLHASLESTCIIIRVASKVTKDGKNQCSRLVEFFCHHPHLQHRFITLYSIFAVVFCLFCARYIIVLWNENPWVW